MSILFFILIVLIAAILQTSTGFGFSIMATPFLLLLFEVKEAIQINLLLSLMISLALISTIKKDVDFSIMKRFIIGSFPGLAFGIGVFLLMDEMVFKLVVGIGILLLTGLLIGNIRLNRTVGRDFLIGGFSGLFTSSIGMPGPPLLLYFAGTEMPKEKLRATTLMFYLYIYSVSLATQMVFAGTTKTVVTWSIYAIPLILLGLFIGKRLFHLLSGKAFQWVMYAILIVTGISLILSI